VITRLLVANRGEIARRVIRTCRSLGISTVAVYSDADVDSPHVTEADLGWRLPGAAPGETYLRADLLLAAAAATGADAVHPGYGFLSENADFAAAVVAARLTWVGPPAAAIAAMGSKVEAKARMAAAGVPVLPTWAPGEVPASAYPVLVKASYGGGGRGMRIVRDAAGLAEAVAGAGREAASAFGDGTVYVESYLDTARHIEVQVLADSHGATVALGERECSIQRRHQKVIEEAPSAVVSPDLRSRLFAAATAAAKEIGYVGAGTVEFMVGADGTPAFLEMNTRLQVEHPVTECVLGLDLVALQIRVAEGEALPWTEPPPVRGHAIEARLCAEEPAADWRPSAGPVHRFAVPGVDAEFAVPPAYGLRLDTGVGTGSIVSGHYDSMLAKVIAWAPTRAEAARRLAAALAAAELHGPTTNRDLLVRTLRHPDFEAADTYTDFLDRHRRVGNARAGEAAAQEGADPQDGAAGLDGGGEVGGRVAHLAMGQGAGRGLFAPLADDDEVLLMALAAALAGAARRRAGAGVLATVPAGWRNLRSQPAVAEFTGPDGPVAVPYRPVPAGTRVVSAAPELVVLESGAVRRSYRLHIVGDVSYVDGPGGSVALTAVDPLPDPRAALAPGALTAPMPGTVLRVAVSEGDSVRAGQLLLTLEAMKMEHAISAPADGVVRTLPVTAGSHVDAGSVLAVVEED
jgi:propionyl-CoA carboxylase alpha chain